MIHLYNRWLSIKERIINIDTKLTDALSTFSIRNAKIAKKGLQVLKKDIESCIANITDFINQEESRIGKSNAPNRSIEDLINQPWMINKEKIEQNEHNS